jgi:hypothetical protein
MSNSPFLRIWGEWPLLSHNATNIFCNLNVSLQMFAYKWLFTNVVLLVASSTYLTVNKAQELERKQLA